jgi:hypothetical protein
MKSPNQSSGRRSAGNGKWAEQADRKSSKALLIKEHFAIRRFIFTGGHSWT